jgi:hypothetical protein
MPRCSTVPQVQGQGRPPGQATGDKHAAVRAGLAGAGPPRGVQPPLPAPQEPPTPPGSQGRAAVGDGVNDQGDPTAARSSSQLDQRCDDRTQIEGEQHGVPGEVLTRLRLAWDGPVVCGPVPSSLDAGSSGFGSASERALTSAASGRGGRSGRPPALGPQLDQVWSRRSSDRPHSRREPDSTRSRSAVGTSTRPEHRGVLLRLCQPSNHLGDRPLALADAGPPRDERGAGKARLGEGGLHTLELCWVQLVAEAG